MKNPEEKLFAKIKKMSAQTTTQQKIVCFGKISSPPPPTPPPSLTTDSNLLVISPLRWLIIGKNKVYKLTLTHKLFLFCYFVPDEETNKDLVKNTCKVCFISKTSFNLLVLEILKF